MLDANSSENDEWLLTEEQLECLATWKEGSLRYLMGRVHQPGAIGSDEDSYRCFVYEKLQPASSSTASERHRTTFLLAQSGDASCSGLTSPTEGSRTLRLTKGIQRHQLLVPLYLYVAVFLRRAS